MKKQCSDQECVTAIETKNRVCGYNLKEGKVIFYCCKVYSHKGKHHSCGKDYREWEKEK